MVDGFPMHCASYSNPDLQNVYWEGFTQAEEATNLFVWVNFLGSAITPESISKEVGTTQSWQQHRYYNSLLINRTPPGFATLNDSAFPRSDVDLRGKIIRSRK